MVQIGSQPQIQPNIIQNSPQQNADKTIQRQVQTRQDQESPATQRQVSQNENFQKLAQDILAKRSAGEVVQKPAIDRGQVVDLLV